MAIETQLERIARSGSWRWLGWGGAAALLLTPLVAMQFTPEVDWTAGDFLFAGIMFGTVGVIMELTVRASQSLAYRAGVAFALAAAFMIVWANGAVGMIGDEGDPANLMFVGVLGIALLGSLLARFRPKGLAIVMVSSAMAQAAAGGVGMLLDPLGGVLSMAFAGPWLVSAALFRKAGTV